MVKRRLSADQSGIAIVELALISPMLLVLLMYGAEVTNYAITRQRISQLALQVADNASRIGKQEVLHNKPITEKQINDLFIGAQMQSSSLNVRRNGRIIVTQLIKDKDTGGQRLQWQRCYGNLVHPSGYGAQGDRPATGIGPTGAKVMATDTYPVIFVEIAYTYKPVVSAKWAPGGTATGEIVEIASLAVRDERDTEETIPLAPDSIYNDEAVTPSLCT